jgi:prolyl-tRNA editing enzyme YbaK/EbsC (Cys-tRNA(Pro) deacylase)
MFDKKKCTPRCRQSVKGTAEVVQKGEDHNRREYHYAPSMGDIAPIEAGGELTSHPAVQRVLAVLALHHITTEVVALPDAARTAAAAAHALAITPAEIANSLVFRAHDSEGQITPLLVITSGAHKVDLHKVADLTDIDHIDRADPEFVRATTGFAIGGVAPVGHTSPVRTIVDVSLSRYRHVWAAAGHSHTVFRTTYEELLRITGGHAMEVA